MFIEDTLECSEMAPIFVQSKESCNIISVWLIRLKVHFLQIAGILLLEIGLENISGICNARCPFYNLRAYICQTESLTEVQMVTFNSTKRLLDNRCPAMIYCSPIVTSFLLRIQAFLMFEEFH